MLRCLLDSEPHDAGKHWGTPKQYSNQKSLTLSASPPPRCRERCLTSLGGLMITAWLWHSIACSQEVLARRSTARSPD